MLAADLGGTKCRFALVGADFSVQNVHEVRTARGQERFLAEMHAAFAAILAALPADCAPPFAAGIGTAGVIPTDGSRIEYAPNLPLDGFGLAAWVQQQFGLRTTLINDGRASAFGEYLRGHARGQDPLLCLFFGTGIGIGLMVDGRPYGGAGNAAGEIGHTVFVPGGRRCPCGGLGHFEAYCGGRAITERALAEIGPPPAAAEAWTVGAVVAHDSPAARAILADAAAAAVAMVGNACTLLNPRAVVLGGGVLKGWPQLQPQIVAGVHAQCSEPIRQGLLFVPSLGGSDAILWGAAAAAGLFAPRDN